MKSIFIVWLSCYFHVQVYALELTPEEQQWISDHPIVKVAGAPDWSPFDYVDGDNNHSGIAHEYLDVIAAQTGLEFKVEVGQWYPNLNKLLAGELDLLPAVAGGDSTSQDLHFSQPYEFIYDYFFIDKKLNISELDELNNLTVAVPSGFARRNFLTAQFPQAKIISTQSMSESVALVLAGQADAILGAKQRISDLLVTNNIKSIVPFKPVGDGVSNRLYMAVPDHALPLLSIIDKVISKLNDTERNHITESWLQHQPVIGARIDLTEAEQHWLTQNPKVVFGADRQWTPFEFRDENGNHQGIAAEYMELIEHYSGLEIEVKTDTWKNVMSSMKNKEIQGLSCAVDTKERRQYLNFTEPYLSIPTAVYIRSDEPNINSLDALAGKSVALNEGSYMHEWLQQQHPEIELYLTTSNKEAVEAVSYGQADAYIGNLAVADYVIKQSLLTNMKVVMRLNHFQTSVSIAVDKDLPELFSIITKSLALISESQQQNITDQWVGNDFAIVHTNSAERQYLREKGVLKYLPGNQGMPFEQLSSRGELVGINADFLSGIQELLNVEIAVESNLQKDGADLSFSHAEDNRLLNHFVALPSHMTSDVVIVMPNQAKFVKGVAQIKGVRIGVISGEAYLEEIIKEHPDINLFESDDLQGLFNLLNDERVDAILLPFAQASYELVHQSMGHLKIAGKTKYQKHFAFYVAKNQPELLSIMTKTIEQMGGDQYDQIVDEWLSVDIIERKDYRLAIAIASVLSLLLLMIILWNRSVVKGMRERLLIEEALAAEKENFEIMFEKSGDANMIFQNGQFVASNGTALKMFGLQNMEGLKASKIEDFLPPVQENGEKSLEFLEKKLEESKHQKSVRFECLAMKKDGSKFWADVVYTRIKYSGQQALYAVWRDVTEHKNMEERLKMARAEAEEASLAKSTFLANMSHEIRTPMNAIIGFTELLDEQVKEPHLKTFVRTIKSAGDTLLMLINDILDLSKIEAGKYDHNRVEFNPDEYFEDIAQIFSINMQKKGLQLILDVSEQVPETLTLDINHLRQVLFNLLGNAIKFSEMGKIFLRVKPFNQKAKHTGLRIEVEDQGIGIPQKEQEKIFEAFEQQKGQDSNKYSGTGLGLAICKKLVELMDGRIWVESETGKGACFIIEIHQVPISKGKVDRGKQNDTSVSPDDYVFTKATLLVVDDNYHNRALIAEHFANTEITTIHAENGLDAVNCIEKHQIDLVLMDIRMPVMDGYESAKIIKSKMPSLPVVALTASVLREDHERIEQGHFDGFLPKPVIKNRLFQIVAQFVGHQIKSQIEPVDDDIPVVVSEVDQSQLTQLLDFLHGPVTKSWELAKATKSMKDVDHLVGILIKSKQYLDLKLVSDYAYKLEEHVSAFNVLGIQSALSEFEQLKQKVSKMTKGASDV